MALGTVLVNFIAKTQAFERDLSRTRKQLTSFQRTTQALTRTVGLYAKSFLIGGGAIYAMKRFTSAAIIQEKAERDLQAAIGGNIQSFKDYASYLQKLTVHGDEQILSQMAYAANLGVTRERLNDVTKAAIGLSTVIRQDLATAMMLLARANKGQTQTVTRYGIQLDVTASKQEQFNQLLKIGADAFELAEKEAQTAAGSFSQFSNAMSDLAEQVGNAWLPILTAITKAFTNTVKKAGEATEALNKYKALTGDLMRQQWVQAPGEFGGHFEGGAPEYPKLLDYIKRRMAAGKEPVLLPEELRHPLKPTEPIGLTPEQISAEKDKVKDYIDFIRNQDYMTRIERLENLKAYQAANAETLASVAEANQLLNEEIAKLESARVDGWKKYMTELREDMQNWGQYVSDKLADVARDAEQSLGSAFGNIIEQGGRWRDATTGFIKDVAHAWSQMAGQMIARQIFGNIFAGGQMHEGGLVGAGGGIRRNMPSPVFNMAPRLHTGLRANEFPAILERGETVVPKGGSSGPVQLIFNSPDAQSAYQLFYNNRRALATVLRGTMDENHTLRRSER